MRGALLERSAELEELSALLDAAAAGHGGLLVIRGEAGIGKTRLLDAASGLARARGMTVLTARGGELERDFGYGVVRQLFERRVRGLAEPERAKLFAGAGAHAAGVLGFGDTGAVTESAVIEHALYWVTLDLSGGAPLALLVDDAHWADTASLRWLVYLARRLEGAPLALVVGWRTGEPDAPGDLLTALCDPAEARTLSPGALSLPACMALLQTVLGPADPAFVAACQEATGGNPFLLGELARAVAAEGVAPAADAAPRVMELGPAAVAGSVVKRIARLGADATALARALAVLDHDADLPNAARLAGLEHGAAAAALGALAESHIFEPGGGTRFAHPILRAAVYGDLPDAERGRMHAAAARLLDGQRRSDRAAVHLLATRPAGDQFAARCLHEAGARALGRGAPDAAVALLRRAVAEPPPDEELAQALLDLGRAERFGGDPAALGTLERALALARDPEHLAAAARELSPALHYANRPAEGIAVVREVIGRLGDEHRELRLRLEAELATLGVAIHWEAPEELTARASKSTGSTPAERAVLAAMAIQSAMGPGTQEQMLRTAELAWDGGRLLEDSEDPVSFAYVTIALNAGDRPLRAREVVDHAVSAYRDRGNLGALALALAQSAYVAWRLGDARRAEADARDALHLSQLAGAELMRIYTTALLLMALVLRGDLDAADAVLRESGFAEEDPPTQIQTTLLMLPRAELRLLQGRKADALRDCDVYLGRTPGSAGTLVVVTRLRMLALHALGRREEALEVGRDRLALARHKQIGNDEAIVLATLGLVEGGKEGLRLLAEGVAMVEGSQRRVIEAQLLLDYGGALRRARRRADARDPLRRALDIAHACGCGLIERQAHEELLAAGGRPRRKELSGADSLTASERRVAELVAKGATNREVAQTLFVTPKTVETHMRAILRKLGVGSRTEVAAALGGDGAAPGDLVLLTIVAVSGAEPVRVRRHVQEFRGTLVTGDGPPLLATFDSPTRAVGCARAIAGEGLAVAVHVGECAAGAGGLSGPGADAARALAASATPGDLLLSDAVRAVAGTV